jgi:hypothetical protein
MDNDYDEEIIRRLEKDWAYLTAMSKRYVAQSLLIGDTIDRMKANRLAAITEQREEQISFPTDGSFLEQFMSIESKYVHPIMLSEFRKGVEKLAGKDAIPISSMYNEIRKLVDEKKIILIQLNKSKKLKFYTTHQEYIIGSNGNARLDDDYKHPKMLELEKKGKLNSMEITGR